MNRRVGGRDGKAVVVMAEKGVESDGCVVPRKKVGEGHVSDSGKILDDCWEDTVTKAERSSSWNTNPSNDLPNHTTCTNTQSLPAYLTDPPQAALHDTLQNHSRDMNVCK